MTENRYDGLLTEYNDQILELLPADRTLRAITAHEVVRLLTHPGYKDIAELGFGELHQTRRNFQEFEDIPALEYHMVDINEKWMPGASEFSAEYQTDSRRIFPWKVDAIEFLRDCTICFDAIVTAWTIHNFPEDDRRELYAEIARKLRPGGGFVMMEKVYTDDEEQNRTWLEMTNRRLRYLPPEVEAVMIEHETQDFEIPYRMNERETKQALRDVGLEPTLVDRVEREVVITARKP